ncbi:hypothetical protein GCM10009098_06610 [Rheinheimera aquimaris]|uniref:Uncharacterized protein n=1 Tax=Rheinheimera aquimaris TaxID=412437 RepID=A0ABN1DEN3_9GAMM
MTKMALSGSEGGLASAVAENSAVAMAPAKSDFFVIQVPIQLIVNNMLIFSTFMNSTYVN